MKFIVIKALMACSVCVLAQMPRGFGMPSFSLLQRQEVRQELRLTQAQEREVEAALAPLYQKGPNGERGIFIRRDTNLAAVQASATKSFTAAQKARLEQIQ